MESDRETASVPRSRQQSGLQQPTISVTEDLTLNRSTSYLPYRFPSGRPLSNCSIESVGSFVCSEASSWLSTDFDDDPLLHAVHRLSMSSCSSWTVSELGDDPGIEGQYEVDDDEDCPIGETDQLIEDSLLALAYLNGGGDDTDTSAMSCQTMTGSDSADGASSDSMISTSAAPENTKDITVNTLRQDRQSRLIEDCDINFKVKLDIIIDDARVAQALLMQQESTLVAMSEARILRIPFLDENMTPMATTPLKRLLSKQLCGLTSSKTLNRLGKLPDVTAVTRSMSTRKQVAHLNFWERMTSNALSEDKMKRRSMLY